MSGRSEKEFKIRLLSNERDERRHEGAAPRRAATRAVPPGSLAGAGPRDFRGPAKTASDGLEVGGGGLAALGGGLERDLLPFAQRGQAGALDGADMDEDVLRAIIGLDESKALGGVEELDGADSHNRVS